MFIKIRNDLVNISDLERVSVRCPELGIVHIDFAFRNQNTHRINCYVSDDTANVELIMTNLVKAIKKAKRNKVVTVKGME